jgi:hypothetical protein
MVVFVVGMGRRIMGLRGTVLPMFVTHMLPFGYQIKSCAAHSV